ncbi:hypothetical protein [Prosthecomicrobium sp. N25]|uniref:hypothetical protein n=1 Tax=Prosthecomicrobium sp. N25 TaxID=3129254 RepID=UPI003077E6BB
MTRRLACLLAAASWLLPAVPAMAQCVPASVARNNPAFSSTAATGARDACAPKPQARAKPKPARPEERTVSGLDLMEKEGAAKAPTVTRDAEGRTVTRVGDTEIRFGGYVRTDVIVSSGSGRYLKSR